jgi:hypothetical protein
MGLKEAIQNIWSSDYTQKNPRKAYKVTYPDEYAAVAEFINGGTEPADWQSFSKLGKGLVETEIERRKAGGPEPVPEPVPEPTPGSLTWAPPGYPNYTGYQRRTISNATPTHTVAPGSNVDVVFTFSEVVTTMVSIEGFRNVVIIGGEINRVGTNVNGMGLYLNDGIVHLEGLYIHGASVRDCIGMCMGRTYASGAPGGTLRMQNCRLENSYTDASYHGDGVQNWGVKGGSPATYKGGCGPVQIDRVSIRSKQQCLYFWSRTETEGGCVGDGIFKNVNLFGYGGVSGQLLVKYPRNDFSGRPSTFTLENFWFDYDGGGLTVQQRIVPNGQGTYYGGAVDMTRANVLKSDAQGQYLEWVSTADVKGIARKGDPPGGDFVPAAMVTHGNYESPGYQ